MAGWLLQVVLLQVARQGMQGVPLGPWSDLVTGMVLHAVLLGMGCCFASQASCPGPGFVAAASVVPAVLAALAVVLVVHAAVVLSGSCSLYFCACYSVAVLLLLLAASRYSCFGDPAQPCKAFSTASGPATQASVALSAAAARLPSAPQRLLVNVMVQSSERVR